MDWTRAVDNYCERIDPGFLAEPLNAVSNAAFVVAALVCWRLYGHRRDPGALVLMAVLVLIGIGSFLFHTVAQVWAGVADVLPILAFIVIYVHLATTRLLGLPVWAGVIAAAAYAPVSAAVSGAIGTLTGPLNGSLGYVPVLLLIGGYALALVARRPATARRLGIGAGLLAVSLTFRTLDAPLCPDWPQGTHFLWHLLNGTLLGWMIATLVRDRDPGGLAWAGTSR